MCVSGVCEREAPEILRAAAVRREGGSSALRMYVPGHRRSSFVRAGMPARNRGNGIVEQRVAPGGMQPAALATL